MKKGRMMAVLTSVCLALVLISSTPALAKPKKIVLKAVVPWPRTTWMVKALFERAWLQTVNEEIQKRSPGAVEIKLVGGPEVVPTHDQGDAVRKGVVDISFIVPDYILSVFPEAVGMQLTELWPWEERQNGAFDFWNKLFQEKMNVVLLAKPLSLDIKYHVWLNKPISKPDLTGLTIRTSPGLQTTIAKKLGASIIVMPPGEVYAALERGVMDAYITVTISPLDYGWYKVTKYRTEVGIIPPQFSVLMNLDSWNKLPKNAQDALIEGSKKAEYKAREESQVRIKHSLKEYDKAGIKVIKFTPEDTERFYRISYETIWKHVDDKFPSIAPDLRRLLKK